MSKIELDDHILRHPKFLRAISQGGSAVIHMWLGLRAYCSQNLTDGHIPTDMIGFVDGPTDSRSRKRAIDCLADNNLLHRVDTGLLLHDYLDHASSREQVLAWREANRNRKRKNRGVSRCDNSGTPCGTPTETPPVTTGVTTSGIQTPSPSLITDTNTDTQDTGGRGGNFVHCPPDLNLSKDQAGILETSMLVPGWAIVQMRAELVGRWVTHQDRKTLEQWRSYLFASMSNIWKSNKRPKKPVSADSPANPPGPPPKPGMAWHKDGYFYWPLQPQNRPPATTSSEVAP